MDKPKKCKRCRLTMVVCNSVQGKVLWCVNMRCPLGPMAFERILKEARNGK